MSDVTNETTTTPALQLLASGVDFTVLLSPTRRGARLARLLTVAELGSRGLPTESAAQVVAELAANAALHGRVPGRSFRLRVRAVDAPDLLRVEVSDTRNERAPEAVSPPQPPAADAESGRGLLLVAALSERWGVTYGPPPCKTVWAEVPLRTGAGLTGSRSAATRWPATSRA
ncbi:ATP-binding protein [Streptomyces smyrnaeus]|uniref:ATP-binding protein n=1 Tax=Streptomyces smyrnaeus TaxID=1387713 RepID=A0ABS3Y2Q1_9ACTN|nr:ATP-binding protein [Streptomyces smyrnaeus]